jgi:hypothetical protein
VARPAIYGRNSSEDLRRRRQHTSSARSLFLDEAEGLGHSFVDHLRGNTFDGNVTTLRDFASAVESYLMLNISAHLPSHIQRRRETGRCAASAILISAAILVLACVATADETAPPTVSYWHVWTDDHGVSRQSRCEMHNFVLQSIEPPASPQWLDRQTAEGGMVIISVLPPTWMGTWHENPKRKLFTVCDV